MSNNYPWTAPAENMDSPEVPIAEAFGIFDSALTTTLDLDLTSGNAVLTALQVATKAMVVKNATVADRTVTVPAVAGTHTFVAHESTTEPVKIVRGTGEVLLGVGESVVVRSDGTTNNLELVSRSGSGGSGSGVPDGGTTGQVLTKTSDADGDADWADAPTGGGITPVLMSFARYKVTLRNAGTELLVSTMTFKDTDDSFHTPTGGSTDDTNSDDVPKIYDGNDATFWYGGEPRYFDFTFSAPFALAELFILQNNGQDYKNATGAKVEGYTGSEWIEVFDEDFTMDNLGSGNGSITLTIDTHVIPAYVEEAPQDGNTYGRKDGAWVELTGGSGPGGGSGEPTDYRYYKITANTVEGNSYACISEIFALDELNADIPISVVSVSSSFSSTYDAAKMRDGNVYTFWHSNTNAPGSSFVILDMGAPAAVKLIRIRCEGQAYTQKINNFSLYGSLDGATYDPILTSVDLSYASQAPGYETFIDAAPSPNTFVSVPTASMIPGYILVVNATGDGFDCVAP